MKKIGKLSYIESIKTKGYLKLVIGIILGFLIASSSVYYAATIYYNGDTVSFDNTNGGLTSDNVQGALDELYRVANLNDRVTALETITSGAWPTYTSGHYYKKNGWVYVVNPNMSFAQTNATLDTMQYAPTSPASTYAGVYGILVGSNGQNTNTIRMTEGRDMWIKYNKELRVYASTQSSSSVTHLFCAAYPAAP